MKPCELYIKPSHCARRLGWNISALKTIMPRWSRQMTICSSWKTIYWLRRDAKMSAIRLLRSARWRNMPSRYDQNGGHSISYTIIAHRYMMHTLKQWESLRKKPCGEQFSWDDILRRFKLFFYGCMFLFFFLPIILTNLNAFIDPSDCRIVKQTKCDVLNVKFIGPSGDSPEKTKIEGRGYGSCQRVEKTTKEGW